MALLWIEGFEGFGDTVDAAPYPTGILARKYSVVTGEANMLIKDGRQGKCIAFSGAGDTIHLPPTQNIEYPTIGFAFKVNAFPSSLPPFLQFYNGSVLQLNARLQSNGTFKFYVGTSYRGVTTNAILADTWYYLELWVKCHQTPSEGQFELRINEVPWLSVTNSTVVSGSSIDNCRLLGLISRTTYFDDLYYKEGTSDKDTSFFGIKRVEAIYPNAAGDSTEFTSSAGANYSAVNEVVLDEDGTYVSSATPGHKDLYNYGSPISLSNVDGIQIMTDARMVTGKVDLHTVIKSGSTEDSSDSHALVDTSYTTHERLSLTNPDTGLAWTPSEINIAQFGVMVD